MPNSLVIDTDIMRAAGLGEEGRSAVARELLFSVERFGHALVWSQPYQIEWEKHASKVARIWWKKMFDASRVLFLAPEQVGLLRLVVESAPKQILEPERIALAKDVFLLEMARMADELLMTFDSTAINLFRMHRELLNDANQVYFLIPKETPKENNSIMSQVDCSASFEPIFG